MPNDETNQAAEEADAPQTTNETADDQQDSAPEPENSDENEAPPEDAGDSRDDVPREPVELSGSLNFAKEVADEAASLVAAQGDAQACWALNRLETLLGSVKTSLPQAIAALGDRNPRLTEFLESLLHVL